MNWVTKCATSVVRDGAEFINQEVQECGMKTVQDGWKMVKKEVKEEVECCGKAVDNEACHKAKGMFHYFFHSHGSLFMPLFFQTQMNAREH